MSDRNTNNQNRDHQFSLIFFHVFGAVFSFACCDLPRRLEREFKKGRNAISQKIFVQQTSKMLFRRDDQSIGFQIERHNFSIASLGNDHIKEIQID